MEGGLIMFNYKCPNGNRMEKGNKVWIQCSKLNNICLCQRYCMQKRDVEHSTNAPNCPYNKENDSEIKD